MAERKVVMVECIDDGDDMTDAAILAGLDKVIEMKKKMGLPALVEKLSPPASVTSADLRKNKK